MPTHPPETCLCPIAGICPHLNGKEMVGALYKICQGPPSERRSKYLARWLLCPTPKKAISKPKVGTALKEILSWFSITDNEGCQCKDRAASMDCLGPEGCEANREMIVKWLAKEATTRGIPFLNTAGHMLLTQAIAKAKRDFKPSP